MCSIKSWEMYHLCKTGFFHILHYISNSLLRFRNMKVYSKNIGLFVARSRNCITYHGILCCKYYMKTNTNWLKLLWTHIIEMFRESLMCFSEPLSSLSPAVVHLSSSIFRLFFLRSAIWMRQFKVWHLRVMPSGRFCIPTTYANVPEFHMIALP